MYVVSTRRFSLSLITHSQGSFCGFFIMATSASASPVPTSYVGQVVVVTGGASGIGYGVAEHFGSLGAIVCVVDMKAESNEAAVAALKSRGFTASHAVADVSVEADWKAALAAFDAAYGRLDVLVQCAGVTGKTGIKTAEVDPDNFDFVMRVNARGIFLGCKTILPYFVARNYGRIVNIASVAGKEGNAGMVAYSASKGAVIALTKAIGKEYAETNITCNALAPAVVLTPMVAAMPAEQVKYMTDKIPMKRCGSISEIAHMIAFIASPMCAFTTGFTFDATGGRVRNDDPRPPPHHTPHSTH